MLPSNADGSSANQTSPIASPVVPPGWGHQIHPSITPPTAPSSYFPAPPNSTSVSPMSYYPLNPAISSMAYRYLDMVPHPTTPPTDPSQPAPVPAYPYPTPYYPYYYYPPGYQYPPVPPATTLPQGATTPSPPAPVSQPIASNPGVPPTAQSTSDLSTPTTQSQPKPSGRFGALLDSDHRDEKKAYHHNSPGSLNRVENSFKELAVTPSSHSQPSSSKPSPVTSVSHSPIDSPSRPSVDDSSSKSASMASAFFADDQSIFVKFLPLNRTKEELMAELTTLFNPINVRIVYRSEQDPRGPYAYLNYVNSDMAQAVLKEPLREHNRFVYSLSPALHNPELRRHTLRIQFRPGSGLSIFQFRDIFRPFGKILTCYFKTAWEESYPDEFELVNFGEGRILFESKEAAEEVMSSPLFKPSSSENSTVVEQLWMPKYEFKITMSPPKTLSTTSVDSTIFCLFPSTVTEPILRNYSAQMAEVPVSEILKCSVYIKKDNKAYGYVLFSKGEYARKAVSNGLINKANHLGILIFACLNNDQVVQRKSVAPKTETNKLFMKNLGQVSLSDFRNYFTSRFGDVLDAQVRQTKSGTTGVLTMRLTSDATEILRKCNKQAIAELRTDELLVEHYVAYPKDSKI